MKIFTLFILLAVAAGTPLHAQISIGFRGGYTMADMEYKDPTIGYKYNGMGTPGRLKSWHADFLLNIPVTHNFYLQPVVRYLTKGANFERPDDARLSGVYLPVASSVKLHYLELPLNIVYKIPLSFGKIAIGAGPYVGYGLEGKYELGIRYNGKVVQNTEQDISFNDQTGIISTNTQLRRWDAGANFMLGLELNNFVMIGANYSLGMTDVDKSSNSTLKHRYLGLSLGFLLNREDY
ncbi:outer membrane beta-barrel protein [Chitinophaga japonensis]|uniref:Outer membrane protein with beta-barrel domain n=1 Tax=Chitinophaga japonensis TaxID=104662 RepID=A0A562TF00_CHIJA|nr:outer membrane beta-barrel protein [Chitinophaga japonensis]TWI91844.1 outer membrane protein with beta-barrel domain [Chitinophaga japonensis]